MSLKNKIFSKFLSKSDSYNYYKSHHEDNENRVKKLSKDFDDLKVKYDSLEDKYENEIIINDFDGMMSRSYIAPVIKYPFSFHEKMCFATMDHLAKYVRLNREDNFNPLVSVIFPVYNYEENILETIRSVLNQTYDNFELIVIDDNSNDNTLKLINTIKDSRIKLISNESKRGYAYSRNNAISHANGKYIFYIDEDNLWDIEYLSTMVGLFFVLPDADAIYTGQYVYDNNFNNLLGIIFGSYNKSLLYNNNFISISALAHKKEVFDKISFDETLKSMEDYHLILSMAKHFKIYSAPFLLSKCQTDKEFHKIWGVNHKLDVSQIKLIHNKLDNTIFQDYSSKHKLNKKISVIIPSYNLLDDLKECIETILSFKDNLIDIIVVDNNSNDEIKNYLEKVKDEGKIKFISNAVNYGFTYAIEQGISISDKDSDILLLNNDAILTKGALEAMQYFSYNLPNCGVIVPREVLYEGDGRMNNHVPYANKNFECDVTPSKNHKNISKNALFFNGDVLELTFAPFFCTYIKREVYNKTLGLDSEIGRHYVSDRLFCDFIRYILNLKIYQISDAIVYHKSQASTNILRKNNKDFNTMFIKNQWEEEYLKELGFRNYVWQD